MPAFVISEVEVLDESAAAQYRQRAARSIEVFGGRYLVRGAVPVVVEGQPARGQIVVVEFPSMERVREWYSSPAYAEALRFRGAALERRLMFVEGVNPPV